MKILGKRLLAIVMVLGVLPVQALNIQSPAWVSKAKRAVICAFKSNNDCSEEEKRNARLWIAGLSATAMAAVVGIVAVVLKVNNDKAKQLVQDEKNRQNQIKEGGEITKSDDSREILQLKETLKQVFNESDFKNVKKHSDIKELYKEVHKEWFKTKFNNGEKIDDFTFEPLYSRNQEGGRRIYRLKVLLPEKRIIKLKKEESLLAP